MDTNRTFYSKNLSFERENAVESPIIQCPHFIYFNEIFQTQKNVRNGEDE